MNLIEYQQAAIEFSAYRVDNRAPAAYPTLGVVEETFEVLESDPADTDSLILELGDLCWYCSSLAKDLGLTLQECYDNATLQIMDDVEALYKNSCRIAGLVKKILRGDDGEAERMLGVRGYLGDQLRRIEAIAGQRGVELGEVCRLNIEKIKNL